VASERLAPEQWWPAGDPAITRRRVTLADGTDLRVLEAGPSTGAPVVLVHGWAVTAYLWRHNIGALAQAGFRVYACDMPGHGLSDAPQTKGSYELSVQAARLAMLLDALALDRPSVVAQSMGGRVAFEVARSGRVQKLALFGSVGFGDVRPERAFAPFIPQIPGDLLSVLFPRRAVEIVQRRVYGKLGWFSERDIDEYWAPTQFPDVLRAQLQMLREFTWEPIAPTVLAECRVPTLVVFGTRDRTVRPVPTAALVAAMPDARLEWIEGGGHVVMEETPDRINQLLIDFLGG
jgi:pimeloyl-ACP methyl ester carboxylesterase